MKDKKEVLTNMAGNLVTSDAVSITTGKKVGYTVLADAYLQEKLAQLIEECLGLTVEKIMWLASLPQDERVAATMPSKE